MINKIIRNFIAKQIAGRSDDGIMITLKDPQRVTLGENIMADLLIRNGIDPRIIKSEDELKMILQQIENARIREIQNTGIRNTTSAKVFDLEGKEIPKGSKIMGGKAIDDDLPPPGSRGGDDDIAAPVQSSEESLKNMMEAENKKAIDNLKQKMAKEKSRTQRISGNLRADNSQRVEIGRPKLDEDEYNYYREILGEDSEVDYYPVKGDETKEFLEAMVKEQKDEMDYMKRLYDKGALDDPEKKADGGRIGFFMGSKFPKGLGALREMVKFFSKGKDKERSGSEILKLVNPKQFNKLLEDPNIYRKFDVQKGIGAPELIKNMQADLAKNRTMMVEEILGAAKNIRKADVDTMGRKNEMVKEMIERGIDRETAGEMADTILRMAEATAGMKSTPKLTDEGILELENILKNMKTGGKDKRSLNADGGRIGLKDGPKMTRRTFLKYLTGLAAIPIVGKIVKPLKTVKGVKNVPIIKTSDVKGKPEWFDQLVNKVIIEGDDVSKKFATKDREIIHMKEIDDETVVKVTQDLDEDAIRVEYESPENMYGDPVQLEFKKGRADEGTKGTPPDEFQTTESIPVARADGPDDYKIDIDEGGGQSISDLVSDVSKLKQYATGKKPTLKEIVQTKKRKDQTRAISEGDYEAETDFVTNRQGEPIIDMEPDIDYASGGIARMLGE